MGNTIYSSNQSQPTDMKSLASHIDDIAVHYILKQNTIDLLRLTDKEYYDNLIVLVGNLFEKKLSDIEIGSLHQRIFPETVQDAVLNLLPSNGKIKDMMISNISKFYIKIMMIFSAIVSTIDPQYTYEDDSGKKQLFYLKDIQSYKHIPKHVQPVVHQLTNPMNLCRKRISILRNKIDSSDPDFITINPGEKLCSTEPASYLTDEIGIKELDLLYYDIFDPVSKTWKSRSKTMDEKYREDLKRFYTIFTGKPEMPPNITSFKDIELFDFRSMDYCRDSLFTHDFIVPKDNELILRYKEQVDLLEQSTTIYRAELLETLKKIFLTKIENENMSYTIQSSLTLQDILNLETETRNTIINLYTNCEQYFIRALLIFEELYDNQSRNMNESRMNNLEMGISVNAPNQPLYKENLINMNSIPQQMPPLNMSPNAQTNMKSNITPNVFNPEIPNPPMANQPVVTQEATPNRMEPAPESMPRPEATLNKPEPSLELTSVPELTPPQVTPPEVTTTVMQPAPEVVPAVTPNVTPEVLPEVAPNVKPEVTSEVAPEVPQTTLESKPPELTTTVAQTTPQVTPAVMPEVTPEVTPAVMPTTVTQTTPEVTPEDTPAVTPQTVPGVTPAVPPESKPEVPQTTPEVPQTKPEVKAPQPPIPPEGPGIVESVKRFLT